jgi:uncharacterized membrane protein YfcA
VDVQGFWVAAILAAMFVGMGKGGVPVIAALAVPTLALFISPVAAAGLLLPVYVVSDLFGLWAYRENFDLRVLRIMLVAMPLGIGLGWATAHIVSDALVTIVVGSIGIVFAANMLLRRAIDGPQLQARLWPGLIWGGIAGFTSFVCHAGGPPYQVYTLPLRMPKATFAGTATIAFAYANAVKLIPYYALGQLSPGNLRIAAVLIVPSVVAVFMGYWLVRILPERVYARALVWALLILSIKLIWDGFHRV